jgi:uncharacterized repeat protein (TIGR03803 family)
MKTNIIKRLFLFTLAAVLGCSQASAQIFKSLHIFTSLKGSPLTNSDGARPKASLVLSGNTLYGTTYWGGTNGSGTVFAINTDGTHFITLHSFTTLHSGITNSDGATPYAGLVLSSNTLYGTTSIGGSFVSGTVFSINTDGTGFTNLHNFSVGNMNSQGFYTNDEGASPTAGLVLSTNTLYGTAWSGGTYGSGTIFAINTDGTGFANLHSFTDGNDGANPYAGLVLSGNTLYGTTEYGGTNDSGTVFAIHTDGTGYTNLYSFTGGNDGVDPYATLVLSGNTLYGTTYQGGDSDDGTVFSINTDGTGYTNLWVFSYSYNNFNGGVNPEAGLVLSGNRLYGTTYDGGISPGDGTVFAINTDGTGFTNLYDINSDDNDGENPAASLILSGNTLYGTTEFAGPTTSFGTVFALSLGSIPLNTENSGTNQILTWGNPAFSLQSAASLTGSWSTVSNAASPYTINTTNTQSFFRLAYTNSP